MRPLFQAIGVGFAIVFLNAYFLGPATLTWFVCNLTGAPGFVTWLLASLMFVWSANRIEFVTSQVAKHKR
jgi:hypothetical protein